MDDKTVSYLKKYGNPDKLEDNLKRLEAGEPVQYIVGTVDFYGYEFIVNKNVLIPRFETEELVNRTIKYIQQLNLSHPNILDLGTGSGCIAITLAKEISDAKVTAVDISEEALMVARGNADKNGVTVQFLKSDMLENVTETYDVIISNPPYIDPDENIDVVVRENEPALALYADNQGLYYYDIILKNVQKNLNNPSLIAFEIGMTQGKQIVDMATKYFPNAVIKLEQDLQQRDRLVFVMNTK